MWIYAYKNFWACGFCFLADKKASGDVRIK
jgi:hypothetical protein